MDEKEVVWPWGMSERDPDPGSRPWIFNPRGFLLAVVDDAGEAERGKAALVSVGFPEGHLRTYSGEQVLEERERFLAQQSALRRVVGQVTSDSEAVELFSRYASDGRAFLWVYVRHRHDADRAVAGLSTISVLHFRYYGDESVEDIHVR